MRPQELCCNNCVFLTVDCLRKQRFTRVLGAVFAAGLLAPAASANRFMVAENIYIGPNEVVDTVVCIACSVRVEGVVEQEVVVIAGGVSIPGRVDGDAVVLAGSLDSAGPIDGDVVVMAGSAKLGASVEGDAVVIAGGLRLAPGIEIDGDAVAVFGSIHGADRAVVRGEAVEVGGESMAPFAISGLLIGLCIFLLVVLLIHPLLVMLGFAVLRERRFRVLADTAAQRGGFSFLIGIGTSLALFLASIVVALTFPVPLPVFLFFVVLSIVGYCGVSYWVGRSILRNAGVLGAAFTGALLITCIQFIPLIGWLVMFVFWNIAIGSAVLSGFGTSVDWLLPRTESNPWSRG